MPREPAPGQITIDADREGRILRLSGEIDTAVIAAFVDQHPGEDFEGDRGAPPITAVDLAGVTFLSSAGLSFLLRATRRSRQAGHLPAMRGLARQARQVIEITGVAGLFRLAA